MQAGSRWTWCALGLAAVGGGCDQAKPEHKAESVKMLDAGDPELARRIAQFEADRAMRDAVFCDPTIEKICAFRRLPNHCDFDAALAQQCKWQPDLQLVKNTCGGVSFSSSGAFGAERWHYNAKHELVGVFLSADVTEYCDKLSVVAGEDCALTGEKVALCTTGDD